jgi:hypothetical protein
MLKIPLQQFCLNMPQDEAQWLWNTIRGIDYSPVRTKQISRSMLSSKQFRPALTNLSELENWMDIFCAEIGTRLEEEGCMTGSNRPKTVNVHWFRRGIGSKSRQAPITTGQPLDREVLFKMAKAILRQLEQEKQLFPCSGCSFSVTGFSGGGNQKGGNERAIETFFTKQAKKAEPEADKEGLEEVEEELELERLSGMDEDDDMTKGRSPSPQKLKPPTYPHGSIQERMEEARRRFFARSESTKLPAPSASAPSPTRQSPERKRFFTGSTTPVSKIIPPPSMGPPDSPSPKRPRFFKDFTSITNSDRNLPPDLIPPPKRIWESTEQDEPHPIPRPGTPKKQLVPLNKPPSPSSHFARSDKVSLFLHSVEISVHRKTPQSSASSNMAFKIMNPPATATPLPRNDFTNSPNSPPPPPSSEPYLPNIETPSRPQIFTALSNPLTPAKPSTPPPPTSTSPAAPSPPSGYLHSDDDPITPCLRCQAPIPMSHQQEHEDYHFAMDLQKQVNGVEPSISGPSESQNARSSGAGRGSRAGRGRGKKNGKGNGQMRLKFG